MNLNARILIAVVMGLTAAAHAHPGPRVWLSIDNGKVVTYDGPYPPATPSEYQSFRVFTEALADVGDDTWETEFPGYQKVPGGTIPAGTTFSYNITGPLLWFNPGGGNPYFETVAEHFGGTPPVPQMLITNGLLQTKKTSSGAVVGNSIYTHNIDTDHAHLAYSLLGDGTNPGGGSDGIYGLQLQVTASGAVPSQTFFLLLGKNATAQDLELARDTLLGRPIPAASGWMVAAMALAIGVVATVAFRHRGVFTASAW